MEKYQRSQLSNPRFSAVEMELVLNENRTLKAENGRLRDYIKSLGERMEKVSDEQGVCKAVVDRWIVEIREALADGK